MVKRTEYKALTDKYNVPCPRYTSYPTVPHWDNNSFNQLSWKNSVHTAFKEQKNGQGISVYIHLPYCESLCTYCGCNTRITINHNVEEPYINTVLKEWQLYLQLFEEKPVISELHLGGGTPTFFSAENLTLLIKGILAGAVVSEEAAFSFEGHPGNTTEQHLQALYELGFRRVSFGIQDFDPKVQEAIHRRQSFAEVQYVTDTARRIGYTSVNFDLVYGLPLQTLESIVTTLEQVNLLNPDRIAFYSYAHVPWLKPGQRKFTEADLPSDEEKKQLYKVGRALLKGGGYREVGMDHFARPGDELYKAMEEKLLHRNFMGYTTSKTHMLIGLGCSSISETETAYAQNLKTVEEYTKAIHSGELAVFNGHLLTKEDRLISGHIRDLMCCYETDISSGQVGNQVMTGLLELQKDGLVILNDYVVKVTEKGKPFVRNICAAFDHHLHNKNSDRPLFSKSV